MPAVFAGGLLASPAEAMPTALVRNVVRAAMTVPPAALPTKLLVVAAIALAAVGVGTGAALLPAGQPRPQAAPPASPPVAHAPGSPAAPRVDAEGVPLPPGVLTRFGSSRMRHAGQVFRIEFAPSGKSLVSASWEGIRIWDPATGKLIRFIPAVEKSWLLGLQSSAAGQDLLTFWRSEPSCLRVLDAKTGRETRRVDLGKGNVQSATISPSGRLVAVSWLDEKTVGVLDTATGKEKFRLAATGHVGRGIAFTADDRTMAVAELGGSLRLYDTATGTMTVELKADGPQGLFITFSPDGRTLVTLTVPITGLATEINLWDVATGKQVRRISGPDVESTNHIAFSPDGKFLAGSNRNTDVILWEAATGREVRRFRCWPVSRATAFSPDGRTLAVAHNEGTITLWDVATGRLLPASADPIVGVSQLRFSANGRQIIGWAGRFIAWDAATGKEVRRYAAPPGQRGQCLLLPDGRLIASLRPKDARTRHRPLERGHRRAGPLHRQ